jgi:hypothetical protein
MATTLMIETKQLKDLGFKMKLHGEEKDNLRRRTKLKLMKIDGIMLTKGRPRIMNEQDKRYT